MLEGFSEEIKEQIYNVQNGYCKHCLNPIHSIHHKLHNTKQNRIRFPLFIVSPMNGVGLCYNCHTNNQHLYKITDKEAQMYENYLKELKGEN